MFMRNTAAGGGSWLKMKSLPAAIKSSRVTMNSSPATPTELSPEEAATSLGVSVQFVLREMAAGNLPHVVAGEEKRILATELAEYARRLRADSEAALDEMAEEARRLGIHY